MASDSRLFWAEQQADKIAAREKFFFTEDKVPKLPRWTFKSSSSLSGVLHIGRLSDIIRGEAVFKALKEIGFPAEFIYVTEDMDPLRKIPTGVPKKFEQYLGFSVSDVPCPFGCHESYAFHFKEEFLRVFRDFLVFDPKVFSMREEYRKGRFTDSILRLVERSAEVLKIIDQFKEKPTPPGWSPWKPICDKCGNLQTTSVTAIRKDAVDYICKDYAFEETTAKGCGHEGTSLLRKANGKLVWKSEWAAQWKAWSVCSEGSGKEYESRNSAFWVNAEICERVLGFPMPAPLFYEHIMIGGEKMSASKGNVVYPKDWLEVSRPECLKYLYMKKLMKARSFSWGDVSLLELDLDRAAAVHEKKLGELGEDEVQQWKLAEFAAVAGRALKFIPADYASCIALVQLFSDNEAVLGKFVEMGVLSNEAVAKLKPALLERLRHARTWVAKHAGPEHKLSFAETVPDWVSPELTVKLKAALQDLVHGLPSARTAEELQGLVFSAASAHGVKAPQLFKVLYGLLIGKERGPKVGSLIIAFGKDRATKRLQECL